jgi:hypothetical protein
MTGFKDYYLQESNKDYKFKVKFAVNEFESETKDCVENCLNKYELRSFGKFKETPIQESPLDFPNVKNTKVFIGEFVLGYPATVDMLRKFISEKTGISEQAIAVYNENDPREVYTQEWLDRMANPDWKKNYKPALGSDYEQGEVPAYGDEANKKLLSELETARKERKVTEVENALSPKATVDRSTHMGELKAPGTSYSVHGGPNNPRKKK